MLRAVGHKIRFNPERVDTVGRPVARGRPNEAALAIETIDWRQLSPARHISRLLAEAIRNNRIKW